MPGDITELEQHLLFHKAISDDEETLNKIGGYMEILSHAETGEKLADPVDEAIRSVFSLVLVSGMDPWEIDLSEFARLYSEKVRDDDFDMIVAGKLVLMAWKILKLQSDSTRERSEPPPEPEFDEFIEDDFNDDFMPMQVPEVVFKEAYRREPVRPVTMIELIDAFEDARREVDIMRERERVREAMKAKEPNKKFDNKAHEEDDEKTVEAVWEKILKMGAGQSRPVRPGQGREPVHIRIVAPPCQERLHRRLAGRASRGAHTPGDQERLRFGNGGRYGFGDEPR